MPPKSPEAAARQITFLEYIYTIIASITNPNLPSPSVRALILNEVFADVNRFLNEQGFPSENVDEEEFSLRNDNDVGADDLGYEADDEGGSEVEEEHDDEAEVDDEEEEKEKEEDAEPRDWRTGGEDGEGLEIQMEEEEEDDRGSLPSYHYESDDYDPGRNSDLDHYNFPEP